ncbi:AI-2E family transporter [Clostridium sp. MB40-C1]|uniref:AI-2E family transporter n=1 Tax=Clostridium sp. MB40-C1 TaxID=3070996 RepID=UPI0027DF4106|nr:AI-2E family transporter [Clostridium sp. MB40-C1]WMJ81052.1 AI-2E family transporter [Clostridium sp. MB40-C1]
MFNKRKDYINLVIAIVIAFIFIKIVDNYKFILDGIGRLISILTPFIYAFLIAYILNPLMSFLEKKFKMKRTVSMLVTYSLIISLIFFLLMGLVPKAVSNLADLIESLPQLTYKTEKWVNDLTANVDILNKVKVKFLNEFASLIPKMTNILSITLNTVFMKTVSITVSLVNIIFGLIISIYVLYDKELFIENTRKFIYIVLKKQRGDSVINFFGHVHEMIGTCIGTKAIDSFIIAVICFIGITILKSPYTIIITIVVGVTNMIPYFGPFVGMITAFIINLFFNPIVAVKILIFLFLLQQFDAWYLDPKLIGNKVGLSPFLMILAITLGGSFFGVLGMFLAAPTMAVIKIYVDKFMMKYGDINSN